MRRPSCCLAILVAAGCAGSSGMSGLEDPELDISNGLKPMSGIERGRRTVLQGSCEMRTDNGSITCDGLVVRLNKAGVDSGIGWELRGPFNATCAGSDTPAPEIAVFSFGTLELAPGALLVIRGPHAVAILAEEAIEVAGRIRAPEGAGGYSPEYGEFDTDLLFGPAPGATVPGEDPRGGGGAGGLTAGDDGGNAGGAGGPALPPQFDPLCGGSAGGSVSHQFDGGGGVIYGTSGNGGAALLLAAGEAIELDGPFGCGVSVDGGTGSAGERGGPGGGAGGTISLEAPRVTVDGECEVSAVGGFGASSESGAIGGAPGDGVDAPEPGADGEYGGGGGGSAGFIRVRASSCDQNWSGILPPPSCELL